MRFEWSGLFGVAPRCCGSAPPVRVAPKYDALAACDSRCDGNPSPILHVLDVTHLLFVSLSPSTRCVKLDPVFTN